MLNSQAPKDALNIIRKHSPKNGLYRKSAILNAYKKLKESKDIKLTSKQEKNFLRLIQLRKTRTISGVTPVTVLTKPYPCPGKCIFCPSDVRMPKSYLSSEPGAQRAEKNKFDPYQQTYNRLVAYNQIGHPTDKVELIILGGTWTSYPKGYQTWFIKRCFDAMNDFNPTETSTTVDKIQEFPFDKNVLQNISGSRIEKTYNQIISKALVPKIHSAAKEQSTWDELENTQKTNEPAISRCVGLVIETRPDEITEKEVIRIRRLGGTKVQIGFQSLSDKVLKMNNRDHNVNTTRKAVKLLRQAGFKIHAHWMPNLYGSNPEKDIKDFRKMFSDGDFMPDELKIYPCSLIASAELMQYYKKGLWKPYTEEELLYVLKECYKLTPAYCRITRMIRDIGSHDIVAGNKKTNFRQIVEKALVDDKEKLAEIRFREIRGEKISKSDLDLNIITYKTSVSEEKFLQYITPKNKIAGFLRLSLLLNRTKHFISELKGSAIIREVHIYGPSIEIGTTKKGKAQHLGLGKELIKTAVEISKSRGYQKISVISSVGTRKYYSKLGFKKSGLYQTLNT